MRTLLALTVAATVLGTAWSLKCHVCNSHLDKDCSDLEKNSDKYLNDCGDRTEGEKYTLCRKLDIYLDMDFGPHHEAENRIHRDCGFQEDEEPRESSNCYYKSGYNTRTWVCSCKEDGCNSAGLPSTTAFLVPLAVVFLAVLRGADY